MIHKRSLRYAAEGIAVPSNARGRLAVVAIVLGLLNSRIGEAQSTTLAGVYSAPQAERGRVTYAGMCRSCHTPAGHSGTAFAKRWGGHTVADLFSYMSREMPKSDPGVLNPEEYADVVAYLLKLNAMPAGKNDLAADSTALAAITLRIPSKSTPAVKPRKKP